MQDSEFGQISVRVNARSKGFTFRVAEEGGLVVTAPPHWTETELTTSIDRMRPKLRQLIKRVEKRNANTTGHHIDFDFQMVTDCLSVEIQPDETLKPNQFGLHKEQGHITITSRPDTDWDVEGRQEWLEKVIVEQVRSYAKGMLPAKLRALSQEFNLPVSHIQINASHGRWGSCSCNVKKSLLGVIKEKSGYNINLSLYTLLLPLHLQRLIMLHELTHTLEMNHSPRFHAKLDAMLGGTETQLDQELKQYNTSIWAFAKKR